jgi:Sensors of blue-light using FAD
MELYQLVYYSRNTIYGDDETYMANVRHILAGARNNNKPLDISGFLLADRSWFFQVLEGVKPSLVSTLDKIYADKRHTGLTIIQNRPILTRSFEGWIMGCSIRTPEKYNIFNRHGITSKFDPRGLNAETIVALAYDLAEHEKKNLRTITTATNALN